MYEKVKTLQQVMNDYLVRTHAEDREIYNNLGLFYDLSFYLEKGLSEHFSSHNETVDYSKITKISLFDKVKLVQSFYKEIGVEFDFDKYINDGTIDLVYYDYFNDNEDLEGEKLRHLGNGNNNYDGSKKTVNICNNGFITDILVTVHELSHFRDQPDDGRNQVSNLLTESLAYAEELICIDYLSELGYKEDMILWEKHLFNTFYNIARNTRPIYKMFLVHQELGNISEENYEYYFKAKDGYKSIIEYMSRFTEKKDFDLYYNTWYVIGAVLGTYMYLHYKKDKSFSKNIAELHNRINDSSTTDCFKVMGLQDFGDEDKEKLNSALDEIKLELNEIGCKKSK